jgi:hypothetical protein
VWRSLRTIRERAVRAPADDRDHRPERELGRPPSRAAPVRPNRAFERAIRDARSTGGPRSWRKRCSRRPHSFASHPSLIRHADHLVAGSRGAEQRGRSCRRRGVFSRRRSPSGPLERSTAVWRARRVCRTDRERRPRAGAARRTPSAKFLSPSAYAAKASLVEPVSSIEARSLSRWTKSGSARAPRAEAAAGPRAPRRLLGTQRRDARTIRVHDNWDQYEGRIDPKNAVGWHVIAMTGDVHVVLAEHRRVGLIVRDRIDRRDVGDSHPAHPTCDLGQGPS